MADGNMFEDMESQQPQQTLGPQPDSFVQEKPAAPSDTNIFQNMETSDDEQQDASSFSPGAGFRAAERGAIPAAAGLAGAGGGGVIGGGIGAAIGAAVGAPFAGVGAVPGAVAGEGIGSFVGGLLGAWGASAATDKAQQLVASKLPDDWRDVLGGSEEQQRRDIQYHPAETFIGGITPFLLTMHPSLGGAAALPENATTFQRITSNPVTSHLFSGAMMGGMELGNEVASGQPPDWRNVAIATGFGTIFNRSNRIGELLNGAGEGAVARAARAFRGQEAVPNAPAPTLAQAGDMKVMGPGVTEEVFMGTQQQAETAQMVAQDAARAEAVETQPRQVPEANAVARRSNPELFDHYDGLQQQADDLSARLAQISTPTDAAVAEANQAHADAQGALATHIQSTNGYEGGPAARRLRAEVQDRQNALDEMQARQSAVFNGGGVDTPEMTALREHLASTQRELWDMAPQIAAANRRAAEFTGAETVEPPAAPEAQPTGEAAPAAQPQVATAPLSPEEQEQGAAIAANVAREMVAAGRPQAEADAVGQLWSSRYIARSRSLNGAVSPEELYRTSAPTIRGRGIAAPEPARAETGAPTPAEQQEAVKAANDAGVAKLANRLMDMGVTDDEIAKQVFPKISRNQVAALRAARETGKPPLMPTLEEPTLAQEQPAEEPPEPIAEAAQAPAGEVPQGERSEIVSLDPSSIGVDANRFQFKAGGDESGVTERLQDVRQWDARLAGTALVWRDAAGKDWIADGHQRLALAKRLQDAGQEGIKLNAFLLNEADGITDADARAIAAAKNIAEGTGSAIDAAKVIQNAKDRGIDLPPLPPRSVLVRDGQALAKLSPEAFGVVVNEVVPPAQGAIVGRLVSDPADQVEALKLLAHAKPDNARQAEMIVRDMMSSGTERMTQQSLFGEEAFNGSVVRERAKVADEALKQLRRDKTTFRTLVDEAERIEGQGNVLERGANESRLDADEKASQFLQQLAFRAGPVSDALTDVARQLRDGSIKTVDAARSFLGSLRGQIESGVVERAGAGEPESGAERNGAELGQYSGTANTSNSWVIREKGTGRVIAETFNPEVVQKLNTAKYEAVPAHQHLGELNTPGTLAHAVFRGEPPPLAAEPGAEGLPQTLIPGVAPVTDADRMALEAGRPLTGGDAAPGSLFDEEARNQRELFQAAYHGSPHIFDRFSTDAIGTGEGAQAYGHGLYFAGKKDVAEWYRRQLAGSTDIRVDGIPIEQWAETNERSSTPAQRTAVDFVVAYGGDTKAAAKALSEAGEESAGSAGRKLHGAAVAWLNKNETRFSRQQAGRLYHVEVPDDHELMDWDKPLSEQPEGVREKLATLGFNLSPTNDLPIGLKNALREAFEGDAQPQVAARKFRDLADAFALRSDEDAEAGVRGSAATVENAILAGRITAKDANLPLGAEDGDLNGKEIYADLSGRFTKTQPEDNGWTTVGTATPGSRNMTGDEAASKALMDAGIPGHQYVGNESQSTNYVIYDDSRVPITNYEQARRGSLTLQLGVRPVLNLFHGNADPSTIIHEGGHAWLEELLKDAAHPAATDQLRTDGSTVRKQLGMTDDQAAPTRRQHERFARWTEQYLREGVAPSPALARVFDQFKTWLTNIYQTLKGLGTPLNEDTRAVFDRLLSAAPQRTVIGERMAGDSIAALHENDAATTRPHEAEPAMERVGAESQHYVENLPEAVKNELAGAEQRHAAATANPADAGAEGGGGATEPDEVVAGGNGPGVEPGRIGSGVEPGQIGAGGATAGEQGAGVAERANAGGGTDAGLRGNGPEPAGNARAATSPTDSVTPKPTDLLNRPDPKLIDKAGNIRLDTLNTGPDVNNAIRLAAAENNDFIGARRGTITPGQVSDLADALGMNESQLNQRKLGQAFNAEQIVAARRLLIQSATNLSDLAKKASDGSDQDVMAYAEARLRHNLVQEQVAGITAEAGRALAAFRRLAIGRTAQGVDDILRQSQAKTLFQLKAEAKMMSALDTPEAVSKFARDTQKADFWDGLIEYWVNALISNPATHVTYATANEMLSLTKAVPETAVAAGIGRIREMFGREGSRVHLAEVGAQLRAHAESTPAALKSIGQSAMSGRTVALPGEDATSLPLFQGTNLPGDNPVVDLSYQARQIMPDLYGATRGILDGSTASGYLAKLAQGVDGEPTISFQPSRNGVIPNIAYKGTTVLPVGEAARLPSRMVAAIHSYFRVTNYAMEVSRLATRQAIEEGLQGDALAARIGELRQNPTPDMMDQARKVASNLTLMGQGGEFTRQLSRLTNTRIMGVPFLKFVDPFVKISSNVIDQSLVQRTPLGLLSSEIRADLSGSNGNVAQDTAMARMLVGSALSLGFGALAARGVITGSGPSDPNKAAIWRMAGYQPHSVKIGDTWYSVGHLGSLGMLMGVASDMYDVAHLASEGDMLQAGAALQHAFTQNILDESFARGPSDLIQAVENPDRYGASYIRNFLSSFLPYSSALRQMDRESDPYSRQARSIMDGIKGKIPGMSESLLPYRDIFGSPEVNLPGLGGMSSIYMSNMEKDPVYQSMVNLGINVGQPSRLIRGVRLSDQQYDQFQVLSGQMAKQRLDTLVISPQWQTWPSETRVNVMEETFKQSREIARNVMMARYPSIPEQATQKRMAKFGYGSVQ